MGREPRQDEKEPLRPLYMYYKKLRNMATDLDVKPAAVVEGAPGRAKLEAELSLVTSELAEVTAQREKYKRTLKDHHERFEAEEGRKILYEKDLGPVRREFFKDKKLKERAAVLEARRAALQRELEQC